MNTLIKSLKSWTWAKCWTPRWETSSFGVCLEAGERRPHGREGGYRQIQPCVSRWFHHWLKCWHSKGSSALREDVMAGKDHCLLRSSALLHHLLTWWLWERWCVMAMHWELCHCSHQLLTSMSPLMTVDFFLHVVTGDSFSEAPGKWEGGKLEATEKPPGQAKQYREELGEFISILLSTEKWNLNWMVAHRVKRGSRGFRI